ncbi:MAG: metallophosphoesterase, partial [Methanosarcinaceae archaeon]
MTIIVVSDVHLGYKNCNKKDFNDFLDELNKRNDLNNIVICGDFIDMWRRDLVGVMLENADIFVKLDNLQ